MSIDCNSQGPDSEMEESDSDKYCCNGDKKVARVMRASWRKNLNLGIWDNFLEQMALNPVLKEGIGFKYIYIYEECILHKINKVNIEEKAYEKWVVWGD